MNLSIELLSKLAASPEASEVVRALFYTGLVVILMEIWFRERK